MLRIANGSGFYGDRLDAMRELVEGGPLDVLTGDYLAELTMLILWRARQRDPERGYARSFLRQARDILAPCVQRGVRVVVNAGGLEPAGLARDLRALATELAVDATVAHVDGDDLLPRLDELAAAGWGLTDPHGRAPLDTGAAPPITANAYLGGWGIAAALEAGADVVVTGRVTDASLTVGPAAWWHGWARDDWDRLAGATVAGHVIECGAQATGGNHPFADELPPDAPALPGFPIAEVEEDGTATITKHPGSGGAVTPNTVTAQLVYEIDAPRYLGPDVVARFDTIRLREDGPDRVVIHGVRGEPPPPDAKVAVNTLGGWRNHSTFVLTGTDLDGKEALLRRQVAEVVDLDALDHVSWLRGREPLPEPTRNQDATRELTLHVTHHEPELIGRRRFAERIVSLALSSYPGFTVTAPPADAEPFGRYLPAAVPAQALTERVVLDERDLEVAPTAVH
ncbi:MAG: acyclic terpene utilization AtuA family protein, partial [Nitriliruptoraceae bacterium]